MSLILKYIKYLFRNFFRCLAQRTKLNTESILGVSQKKSWIFLDKINASVQIVFHRKHTFMFQNVWGILDEIILC